MDKWLKIEIAAVLIFVLGCSYDHLTTAYGLMLPNIIETNAVVVFLMRYGIWHLVEIIIITAGIGLGYVAFSSKADEILYLSSIALTSGGLVRLFAGIQNLTIILNII